MSRLCLPLSCESEVFYTCSKITGQLNFSVYVAIGGHCYATLLKIHIPLTAFDRLVYREIELIALMLMTSSKTRAPELRMITRDFY